MVFERRVDDLVNALREGSGDRHEAVETLAQLGEWAVDPLIALMREFRTWEDYESNATAFHSAEDTLIKIGEPSVEPLIRALKEQENWGALAGAIYCLGEINDGRAVPPLIETLATPDAQVHTEVVDTLLKFGDDATRPLIGALAHKSARVRQGAAFALGLLKPAQAVMPLIAKLEQDQDASVRAFAAEALSELHDARAVEPLIHTLAHSLEASVREAAVRALGRLTQVFGGRRSVEALAQALGDVDWGVRQSAAEMLLRLENLHREDALKLLLNDLGDADAEVRLGAAWSLRPFKDARAVDPLVRLLYTPDIEIAIRAALALGDFDDPRAVPALMALRTHADSRMRHAAAASLRKLGVEG